MSPTDSTARPRSRLRGWLVVLASTLPTLALIVPAVVGRALLLALGRRTSAERWSARVQQRWARWTLAILGVEVRGARPPAQGPCLIAANHLSWLDIFVLSSLTPCRFVAKLEIATWPVFGPVARSVGTLFVDRRVRRDAVRVGAEMGALLAAGVSVVVFAEGRVSEGKAVAPFHPALFEPAAAAELPCVPATLGYGGPAAFGTAYTVGWWGRVNVIWHASRLARFGPIWARVRWGPQALVDPDRKRLAAAAEETVRRAFEPLTREPRPPGDPRP